MLIFQTLGAIEKIIAREKTQTRRFWDDRWSMSHRQVGQKFYSQIYRANKRIKYEEGQTHAILVGRGHPAQWFKGVRFMNGKQALDLENWSGNLDDYKAGAGRQFLLDLGWQPLQIQIINLWREDIRDICQGDIEAEGYATIEEFMKVWEGMHKTYRAVVLEFKRL